MQNFIFWLIQIRNVLLFVWNSKPIEINDEGNTRGFRDLKDFFKSDRIIKTIRKRWYLIKKIRKAAIKKRVNTNIIAILRRNSRKRLHIHTLSFIIIGSKNVETVKGAHIS